MNIRPRSSGAWLSFMDTGIVIQQLIWHEKDVTFAYPGSDFLLGSDEMKLDLSELKRQKLTKSGVSSMFSAALKP